MAAVLVVAMGVVGADAYRQRRRRLGDQANWQREAEVFCRAEAERLLRAGTPEGREQAGRLVERARWHARKVIMIRRGW